VRVLTVKGGAQVDIPPRTPSGRTFRLQGWGVERTRDGRTFTGDHVVRVVEMPGQGEG
jgi:DnaJ-class molecular chaperone